MKQPVMSANLIYMLLCPKIGMVLKLVNIICIFKYRTQPHMIQYGIRSHVYQYRIPRSLNSNIPHISLVYISVPLSRLLLHFKDWTWNSACLQATCILNIHDKIQVIFIFHIHIEIHIPCMSETQPA